jgi:uncharacterized membrane protein
VRRIRNNPWVSIAAGFGVGAALLAACLAADAGDALGLVSFLIRFVHVLAATVWVGLIAFMNLVMPAALAGADEAKREPLLRLLLPPLTAALSGAAVATVLAGALLLLPTGYVLPALVYGSGVYMPLGRQALLWSGILAALAMLGLLHMSLAPAAAILLGERPADEAAKQRARAQMARIARVNLLIAVPVLLTMLAVAHLY